MNRIAAGGALLAALLPFPASPPAAEMPQPARVPDRLASGSAAQQPDFRWRGRIERGKTIEVRGVNGEIRAELASGDEVEVTAIKSARRSDPESVTIEVVPHEDGITICAVYPSRRAARPNECRPGGGRNDVDNNDVEVRFTVRVPAGVRLVGATVNGSVDARGLRSDVQLNTVNGRVEVTTTGLARASTVNGSIDATLGRAEWTGGLEFSTVNGSITVAIPAGLDADLEARTMNGEITSDFPLTVSGRLGPHRLRGTIGEGGRTLRLTTVNGAIRLRRAASG